MPIIPLLNPVQGNLVADAPSIGAAMAPGLAVAKVGQTITGAAELGLEAAMKIKAGNELGTMNEAKLAVQQALASHEEFRAQNPNKETDWEAHISKALDTTREEMLKKPGLSPEFRTKLADQFTNWKTDYATKARTDALIHGRARDRTTTTQLAGAYRRAGKYDDARAVLKEAGESELFSTGEIEADLMDIEFDESEGRKREVATKYQLGIDEDPTGALEVLSAKGKEGFLNEPDMEEGTRFRLIKQAERELAIKREEEFDIFKDSIDRGEVTAAELERLPLFLGDAEKKSLGAYLKRQTPPTEEEDRTAWAEVMKVREAFSTAKAGTIDEVTYRNAHRDARAKILEVIPQGYNGPLLESLQHYSPARIFDMKPGTPPTRDEVKKDLSIEIRSTLSAAYDAEFFGPVGEDTPPMEKEKAARKRRDLENKAMEWIASQKDPTPEAARAYTDSLLSGDRVKSTVRDLQSFVPGSGQRFRAAPAMPPLPPKRSAADKAANDPLQVAPGDGEASDALLPVRQQLETFITEP